MEKLKIYYTSRKTLLLLLLILFLLVSSYSNNLKNLVIAKVIPYMNQKLKLFIPSKKCGSLSKGTLFFESNLRTLNHLNSTELKEIILKDENDYVSFFLNDKEYYGYVDLLEKHGLIKSNHLTTEHNLYFCNIIDLIKRKKIPLKNIRDKNYYINQYQKIFKLINKYTFIKQYLILNYDKMKNIFIKDYNYMPETFYYPEDKYFLSLPK